METDLPLVTVVALCYNHANYVTQTIESVIKQSYRSIELIIIDDASSDDSVNVIKKYITDNGIECRVVFHDKNKGICKSLNESLQLAKGRYFKVIACDDILLTDCIASLVEAIHGCPDAYAMVYANIITIDEQGSVFGSTPFEERGWLSDEKVPSGNLFVELSKLCFIPAPSVLLRTDVARALKYDETLFFEDWDMWLRISRRYMIKGTATPVVKYRIHQNSMYEMKSPAFRDSELRTAEKHMGFNEDADKHFEDFIYRNSIFTFTLNGLHPLYWLWKRFLIKKTFKNLLHVILILLGVSFEQKQKYLRIPKWIQ